MEGLARKGQIVPAYIRFVEALLLPVMKNDPHTHQSEHANIDANFEFVLLGDLGVAR